MSLIKIRKTPDSEYLNCIFDYDPVTGSLNWTSDLNFERIINKFNWTHLRCKRFIGSLSGKTCGHIFKSTSLGKPLLQVRIDGKSYYAHRIIWKMYYGEEPDIIDHIDGNAINNKIINLRNVDNQENCKNFKLFKTNTSGFTGVSFSKSCNKYEAYYWENYKKVKIGYYDKYEDAVKARDNINILKGFHENHGKR